jgi:hypothetical protein
VRFTPRKSLDYTITVAGPSVATLHNFLVANQASTIQVADPTRQVLTTAGLAYGASAVAVNPPAASWLAAGVVIALRSGSLIDTGVVESIIGGVLTLEGNSTQTWPAGTRITPVLSGRLKTEMAAKRPASAAVQATIHIDVSPGSEILIDPPGPPQTFNDRELVLLTPNWAQDIEATYVHDFETLDFGRGVIGYYQPIAYAQRVIKATFLGRSAADMQAIEAWFERAKGQRGEFYMPTWDADLTLAAAIGATDTSFLVPGLEVFNTYATDTVFRAVMVLMQNGTQYFGKVSAITASGINTSIALTAALGTAINPAQVQMISWMPVWRHGTDTCTSEWLSDAVAQNQLTLRTVEDLQPEG